MPYFKHSVANALYGLILRDGCKIEHILVANVGGIGVSVHIHSPLARSYISTRPACLLFGHIGVTGSNILSLQMIPVLRKRQIHVETIVRAL